MTKKYWHEFEIKSFLEALENKSSPTVEAISDVKVPEIKTKIK